MSYSYDRTAAGASTLFHVLSDMAPALEKELTAKAQKYTGESKYTKAQVQAEADGLQIRVWLDLGEDSSLDAARELTAILLGTKAKVGQHSLLPTVWVAVVTVGGLSR